MAEREGDACMSIVVCGHHVVLLLYKGSLREKSLETKGGRCVRLIPGSL